MKKEEEQCWIGLKWPPSELMLIWKISSPIWKKKTISFSNFWKRIFYPLIFLLIFTRVSTSSKSQQKLEIFIGQPKSRQKLAISRQGQQFFQLPQSGLPEILLLKRGERFFSIRQFFFLLFWSFVLIYSSQNSWYISPTKSFRQKIYAPQSYEHLTIKII